MDLYMRWGLEMGWRGSRQPWQSSKDVGAARALVRRFPV